MLENGIRRSTLHLSLIVSLQWNKYKNYVFLHKICKNSKLVLGLILIKFSDPYQILGPTSSRLASAGNFDNNFYYISHNMPQMEFCSLHDDGSRTAGWWQNYKTSQFKHL